jgi:hypothetical protein
MTRRYWIPVLLLAAALAVPATWSLAEEPAGKDEKAAKKDDAAASKTASASLDQSVLIASNMPVFVPPNRGAPPMRLGGATRSARQPAQQLPRMEALVPEEPGWTLEAQPVLYWYLAETTDVPLEFGVQRVDPQQQVVRKRLPAPKQAGIQRIDLADYGVTLEPGPIYFWFVKLVPDPQDPEQDKIVGGGIRRVTPDDALVAELSDPATSRPHVLASAGLWYDAVEAYSKAIEARPDDAGLRAQRAKLLEQVDIEIDATAR